VPPKFSRFDWNETTDHRPQRPLVCLRSVVYYQATRSNGRARTWATSTKRRRVPHSESGNLCVKCASAVVELVCNQLMQCQCNTRPMRWTQTVFSVVSIRMKCRKEAGAESVQLFRAENCLFSPFCPKWGPGSQKQMTNGSAKISIMCDISAEDEQEKRRSSLDL
jgi:hypothetical protein